MLTFVSNKEVRIIPKGWSHPRDERGRHRPLLPADRWPSTPEEQRQWMAEYETAEPPNPGQFMASVHGLPAGKTEIVAYETTGEGTPISPAFPNTPEGRLDLVNYCAEHCTTFAQHMAGPEAWAAILFGDGTAVVSEEGTVYAEWAPLQATSPRCRAPRLLRGAVASASHHSTFSAFSPEKASQQAITIRSRRRLGRGGGLRYGRRHWQQCRRRRRPLRLRIWRCAGLVLGLRRLRAIERSAHNGI